MLDVRLIFDHISDMQALDTFINCYSRECSKSVFMEIRSLPTIGWASIIDLCRDRVFLHATSLDQSAICNTWGMACALRNWLGSNMVRTGFFLLSECQEAMVLHSRRKHHIQICSIWFQEDAILAHRSGACVSKVLATWLEQASLQGRPISAGVVCISSWWRCLFSGVGILFVISTQQMGYQFWHRMWLGDKELRQWTCICDCKQSAM